MANKHVHRASPIDTSRVRPSDGNTALVGNPLFRDAMGFPRNTTYVFSRAGNIWTEQQRLPVPPNDRQFLDGDLDSVALSADGKTAMVGAPNHRGAGGTDSGAVYMFARTSSEWALQIKLEAPPPDLNQHDNFGLAIALSADGSTGIVGGVLHEDSHASRGPAVVYIFTP